MSLADTIAVGVAERARRTDVSAWQKARDMADLQLYLAGAKEPHSTRDLARLTGVPQSKVAEQLVIATRISSDTLAASSLSSDTVSHVAHVALLRIAKLPPYLRSKPLREAAKLNVPGTVDAQAPYAPRGPRERQRAAAYARIREEGRFMVNVRKPARELSPEEARGYLDELLPAVANLAEVEVGRRDSYYIGLTGNGGILIYLAPRKERGGSRARDVTPPAGA